MRLDAVVGASELSLLRDLCRKCLLVRVHAASAPSAHVATLDMVILAIVLLYRQTDLLVDALY